MGEEVDVAVVGAGPAGITAALYAKRKALGVRIFEAQAVGGQAADAIWVENYPGVRKLKGAELARRMAEHLKGFGVEVEEAAEVTDVKKLESGFELEINDGEERVSAKAVVLAAGSKYRTLNVPGEKELYKKGLSYCATCDGPAFKGKRVAVVGAGNSGANAALFFSDICSRVYLIEFNERPAFDSIYEKPVAASKAELVLGTQVAGIEGKARVEGIRVKERASGKERIIGVDGVFVYAGMLPRNGIAKRLGAELDAAGYVKVDMGNRTNVKGLFAAGDVTGELAQVVVAAGSGAVAATSAFEYVKGLE